MRGRVAAALTALCGPAVAATAQQAYEPLPPGTLITWSFDFDGEKTSRLTEIIATGDDFVIYDPDLRYAAASPEEYVVEFSGVHAQPCDQALPSEAERERLRALWPLQAGGEAAVSSAKPSAAYTVEASEDVAFISTNGNSGEAWRINADVGDAAITMLVSPDMGMPVAIAWDAGGSGKVLEIVEPQGSSAVEERPAWRLGQCARLLQ